MLKPHSSSLALWHQSIPTSTLGRTIHQVLPFPSPSAPMAKGAFTLHLFPSPFSSHAGLPLHLPLEQYLVQSQLSLQLDVSPSVFCDQINISIQNGSPAHVTTTDTALHPQHTTLSLQLPMTQGVCLSFTWQNFFHFLWFLIYKPKMTYFSIPPPLGPSSSSALIFGLQWWQGVKEFDTANALRIRCTEKQSHMPKYLLGLNIC